MKPDYVVFYSAEKIFILLRKFRTRFFTGNQALKIIKFVFPFGAFKGNGVAGLQSPNSKAKFKNTDFIYTVISKVSHDLRFGLNEPIKLADHLYTVIVKNVIKFSNMLFFSLYVLIFPLT